MLRSSDPWRDTCLQAEQDRVGHPAVEVDVMHFFSCPGAGAGSVRR